MSGTWRYAPPRRLRHGAALTLVFASVLATGAATGSWEGVRPATEERPGEPARAARETRPGVLSEEVREAKTKIAAEELVSRSGDRWSTAYTASEYEAVERSLDGTYVGVGVTVERAPGSISSRSSSSSGSDSSRGPHRVRVAEVRPGSPADRAGIRAGDRLLAVDGRRVTGRPVTTVVAWLRGASAEAPTAAAEPGTEVALEVSRDGRRWSETLRRARLDAGTVTVEQLSPQVTRIKITSFTEGSGARVQRAVEQAPENTSFLLDLRGNSGGLVTEATAAASAFLDGGLVATYNYDGEQCALYAEPGGNTEAPLVVLVDGGTMSAGELLTAALRDRGRAVTVGSRTMGKGTVQVPHRMPDGSVAQLTVGRYASPSGRIVPDSGLVPDLVVDSASRVRERAREVLSGLGGDT